MFKLNISICLFIYVLRVYGDIFFSDLRMDYGCKNICSENVFLLPGINDANSICQRGCRFFDIIYLKNNHDLNLTKDECYSSCNEAYDTSNASKTACNIGCDAMLKYKQNELTSVLAFMEQDSSKNLIFMETEIELLESDLLSDPLIKKQIELGYNIEYKIPETKIRTMPIEEIIEAKIFESHQQNSGDWLDCASKNSGIPKWILLLAILIAILIGIMLSISTDRVKSADFIDDLANKSICEEQKVGAIDAEYKEKDSFLSCDNQQFKDTELLIDNEVNFSKPSKYANETEAV